MKYFIIFAFALSLLILPSSVIFAQGATNPGQGTWSCDQLKAQIGQYGSGRALDLPKYCTVSEAYQKISGFLYFAVGILAVLAIMYGGFVYMTARENDTQKKQGKDIILYAILGLVIAICAVLIVQLVINFIVDNKIF